MERKKKSDETSCNKSEEREAKNEKEEGTWVSRREFVEMKQEQQELKEAMRKLNEKVK